MRVHDEHWHKRGWSQIFCRNTMHPSTLIPSQTMKACVLSNHVKFWYIHAQFEGISTLATFIAQRAVSVDHGIGDGLVGRCSMTFQESFNKYFIDGNGKWWQWDCMMNVDENVDDLKDYASTTCILEPWNPPTPWRHVSYLTMSNFDAYRHKFNEFQRWPLSLINVQRWWIMALVRGLLEDIPWHFKRVLTKIPLMGMMNDDHETTRWTLMQTWKISKIMWEWHASLSL